MISNILWLKDFIHYNGVVAPTTVANVPASVNTAAPATKAGGNSQPHNIQHAIYPSPQGAHRNIATLSFWSKEVSSSNVNYSPKGNLFIDITSFQVKRIIYLYILAWGPYILIIQQLLEFFHLNA